MDNRILTGNFIIYCRKWKETVAFYRNCLNLPINYSNDWFVEFRLTGSARLSIANEERASIKSSSGRGITLSLEVKNLAHERSLIEEHGVKSTSIKKHGWGAHVFYIKDPEGNRIEFWQSEDKKGC